MKNSKEWKITSHSRIKKQLKKIRSDKSCAENKIKNMISKISNNPFYYGDCLEPLSTYGDDYYSRKISRGGRLVYKVNKPDRTICLISVCGHYSDNGGY